MDEARSFAPLLIVVMLAFLVPLLLSSLRRRLAIPIVVGEIVGGMVVVEQPFTFGLPLQRQPCIRAFPWRESSRNRRCFHRR